MENTVQNKAKFFAQYWGQKVVDYKLSRHSPIRITEVNGGTFGKLILKPLSSITEEDAEVIKRMWRSLEIDYLRSKGYAIPYMGLSVEKLVDYGWITLKD